MDRGYCQGCGAQFQHEDERAYGYLPAGVEVKGTTLCQRCFRIKHYGRDEQGPVSRQEALSAIRAGLAWCDSVVLVVDLIDFDASLPEELLGLLRQKPVLLAVNKVDLLPKQTPIEEAEVWVRRRLKAAGYPGLDVAMVSAVNGFGFAGLAERLEELGPKILFAGVSNTGKSSVLERLLQMRIGGGRQSKIKPTVSPYPGTTVNVTRWRCPNGLVFADSPGYVVGSRVSDMVSSQCARKIIPHKRLSSHLYPLTEGDLIYIPGLCGVECLSRGESVLLGYAGSEVKWSKSSVKHIEKWLFEFQGPCTAQAWEKREIKVAPGQDLVISGLGWVSIRKAPAVLRVHYPAGIKISVRPNLIGSKK